MGKKTRKTPITPARARFGEALARWRREMGHATAYQFYHKSRHKKLSIGYHYYLLIEQGVRLPSRECLKEILDAFRARFSGYFERRELLTLYLEALLEEDPLFSPVFEKLRAPDQATESADELVLKDAGKRKLSEVPQMTAAQMDVAMALPSAFWTLQWLLETGQTCTAAQLAPLVGFSEVEIGYALHALAEAGLVRRGRDGAFRCPHAESDLWDSASHFDQGKRLWVSDQITSKIRGAKMHTYSYTIFPVESDSNMAALVQFFNEAFRKAYLLRPRVPVNRGMLTAFEFRVSPLLPIPRQSGS